MGHLKVAPSTCSVSTARSAMCIQCVAIIISLPHVCPHLYSLSRIGTKNGLAQEPEAYRATSDGELENVSWLEMEWAQSLASPTNIIRANALGEWSRDMPGVGIDDW